MAEHRPVTAVIAGSGFTSRGGGFTRITIHGQNYHPDDVAMAVRLYGEMLAAFREIVSATQADIDDAKAANRASEIAHAMIAKAEGR